MKGIESLDFCNICETDFTCDDEESENVVLSMDGYIQDKSDELEAATFVQDDGPYRGAYCLECWDELMGLERKLWKEKYDKRGTSRLLLFP